MRHAPIVLLAALAAAPSALSAPPTGAQVAKYRHEVMESLGAHMSALSMIVKGESDRTQDVVVHATAIHDLGAGIGALFPDGSGPTAGIDTDAKAEVWTQKDKFATSVKAFQTEAAKLLDVAKRNDLAAVKTAFAATGGTCGDCHDVFKTDDEDH
jgi:cytochrome c556